jgi:putative transposase
MALLRRRPPTELIHHFDRGVQYASTAYTSILNQNKFTQSMSRTGNCYDNAMVESFFHTLKVERVNLKNYQTKKETLDDIINYIENWYNKKRSHSSLDYLSPTEYEAQYKIASLNIEYPVRKIRVRTRTKRSITTAYLVIRAT